MASALSSSPSFCCCLGQPRRPGRGHPLGVPGAGGRPPRAAGARGGSAGRRRSAARAARERGRAPGPGNPLGRRGPQCGPKVRLGDLLAEWHRRRRAGGV
ncbi:unnamed protein product [Rangifer tarandus platyrhynchus]|uniref:Uncharacterized protein n=2 Tax=Rangifer tarandus platyrhynchus TaxID=3082113 RepID=A0ABN8ZI62_RANTA|nr:unnamed protein product [Rangifer tarandus platyrhynchus]CAI9708129.1 unnamed protein product [Rangifer tarandus platyrhynchus]